MRSSIRVDKIFKSKRATSPEHASHNVLQERPYMNGIESMSTAAHLVFTRERGNLSTDDFHNGEIYCIMVQWCMKHSTKFEDPGEHKMYILSVSKEALYVCHLVFVLFLVLEKQGIILQRFSCGIYIKQSFTNAMLCSQSNRTHSKRPRCISRFKKMKDINEISCFV